MPRDGADPQTAGLPCWLAPVLLRRLADGIAADVRRGTLHPAAVRFAHERCRALRPGWPATHIAEAVGVAAWLAESEAKEPHK